jgi:hypothetical protein
MSLIRRAAVCAKLSAASEPAVVHGSVVHNVRARPATMSFVSRVNSILARSRCSFHIRCRDVPIRETERLARVSPCGVDAGHGTSCARLFHVKRCEGA